MACGQLRLPRATPARQTRFPRELLDPPGRPPAARSGPVQDQRQLSSPRNQPTGDRRRGGAGDWPPVDNRGCQEQLRPAGQRGSHESCPTRRGDHPRALGAGQDPIEWSRSPDPACRGSHPGRGGRLVGCGQPRFPRAAPARQRGSRESCPTYQGRPPAGARAQTGTRSKRVEQPPKPAYRRSLSGRGGRVVACGQLRLPRAERPGTRSKRAEQPPYPAYRGSPPRRGG
ncbi:hypothetical protein JOD54_003431 [Actinokineospora baliensis]|nr:hypothetical protein [Actinokineospora baliensis]